MSDVSSLGALTAFCGGDRFLSLAPVIDLPPLTWDAVAYIAQNPINRNEYAIATFERNVYLTQDQGKTGNQIANRGQTQ